MSAPDLQAGLPGAPPGFAVFNVVGYERATRHWTGLFAAAGTLVGMNLVQCALLEDQILRTLAAVMAVVGTAALLHLQRSAPRWQSFVAVGGSR